MSDTVETFLHAAMRIGLGARLAAVRADVDQAIAAYPVVGDQRWLAQLKRQRQRLHNPDMALVAAIVAELLAEDVSRVATVAPIARQLAPRHPWAEKLVARHDVGTVSPRTVTRA